MATKVQQLVEALATPSQEVEDTLIQLLTERAVDTAIGAQLDLLGKLVGEKRQGAADEDYRRRVRARISANRSEGTVEDIILVARQTLGDPTKVTVHLQPPAAVVVRILNDAVTDATAAILAALLRDAAAGGVRIILESSSTPPGTTFKWDTPGRGWDQGAAFLDANGD